MTNRLLCRIGFHRFTRVEVHYHQAPAAVAQAALIERCTCGVSRLLRDDVTVSAHVSTKYLNT